MKQDWLWTVVTTLTGAIIVIFYDFLKERWNRKTQMKLERLKIYDEKRFKAYIDLNEFISIAYSLYWPPDEPRRDFNFLMKNYFFKMVKVHYPYFRKDVREKVNVLADQYLYSDDPDLYIMPFDKFMKDHYLELLNGLNKTVEKIFDEWDS